MSMSCSLNLVVQFLFSRKVALNLAPIFCTEGELN
jgi:hypothetical protein